MTGVPLLDVEGLRVEFETPGRVVHAVRGVGFQVRGGEAVGIVGESGCGKSVTAMSLLGLIDPPGRISAGAVRWRGRDLVSASEEEIRALRGNELSMIFQDPMTSLNPVLTIGRQLDDVQRAHGVTDASARREASLRSLTRLGIADARSRLRQYPHQFSGGMRQRVMIAMALLNGPDLLVADEPTTALDVTVQAQIVDLLRQLKNELGMAVVFISHDLRVVSELCDRILVFYAGKIVECGPAAEVFDRPRHPYTTALLRSLPEAPDGERRALQVIPGAPPSLATPPRGCAFAARCDVRIEQCGIEPELAPFDGQRAAACWHRDAPVEGAAVRAGSAS